MTIVLRRVKMKIRKVKGRYIASMTRNEAFLLKDAMSDFAINRSEGLDWDSTTDPMVVSQINKVLDKVE